MKDQDIIKWGYIHKHGITEEKYEELKLKVEDECMTNTCPEVPELCQLFQIRLDRLLKDY